MKPGTFQGLAALILALGVAGTLIIFAIAGSINHRETVITADEATALTTVLGAAIGALAVYLGGSRNGNGNGHGRHAAGPPPPEVPPSEPPPR